MAGIRKLLGGAAVGCFAVLGSSLIPAATASSPAQVAIANTDAVVNAVTSGNWSGYVGQRASLNTHTFSAVGAAFAVPALTCNGGAVHRVSIWAGLGGVATNDSLYQVGIEGICRNGVVSYYGWHEVVGGPYQDPGGEVTSTYSNDPVIVGDQILAEVFRFGSTVAMDLWDLRDNNGFNGGDLGGVAYSNVPQSLTAECVVERPSVDFSGKVVYKLPDFGVVNFAPFSNLRTGCAANDQTNQSYELSSPSAPWTDYPVNMVQGKKVLASAATSGAATVTFHAEN